MSLSIAVEGDTDFPVVRKLAKDAGFDLLAEPYDMGGKHGLDERLSGFNNAAQGAPWLVLRDLDHDALCAAQFIENTKFVPSRWMSLRIAERETEAWLLADRQALADYLHISVRRVPMEPDREADPKRTIVDLARRSKRQSIKRAFVPKPGRRVQVGPEYEGRIIEFGTLYWDVARAAACSPSLMRARRALRDLRGRWTAFTREP
jgi:hypothetical protein